MSDNSLIILVCVVVDDKNENPAKQAFDNSISRLLGRLHISAVCKLHNFMLN